MAGPERLEVGLSVEAVAAVLGVSQPTVRRLLKRGELGCCRVSRRVTVPASEVERYRRENWTPGVTVVQREEISR